MVHAKVYLYKEKDGSYSCYMDDNKHINYGLIGEGATSKEAIDNWYNMYEDMKQTFEREGRGTFVEAEFEFVYDLPSLLNYYAGRFTYARLSRIIGISAAQLSQYANGYRNASPKTTAKIQAGLHKFGQELSQINLM